MAASNPTGRATTMSMADFNERAKRAAAATPTIEKPPEKRRNAPRPTKPPVEAKPEGDAENE
ncbi:hypothetical protein [Methylobacterium sp. Leaf118]|uniref:hypothetical protein n=1 Tax=Methylobacterium sp. Leaf118 TaxID=2876562 RepID=UPI001E300F79|nr:hypothetical protein [Methylobacterium sp. Leaf118]